MALNVGEVCFCGLSIFLIFSFMNTFDTGTWLSCWDFFSGIFIIIMFQNHDRLPITETKWFPGKPGSKIEHQGSITTKKAVSFFVTWSLFRGDHIISINLKSLAISICTRTEPCKGILRCGRPCFLNFAQEDSSEICKYSEIFPQCEVSQSVPCYTTGLEHTWSLWMYSIQHVILPCTSFYSFFCWHLLSLPFWHIDDTVMKRLKLLFYFINRSNTL